MVKSLNLSKKKLTLTTKGRDKLTIFLHVVTFYIEYMRGIMAPFREKLIKWDGDAGDGRYKDIDGFKFDIVAQSVVSVAEDMPKYLLSNDPENATAIYNQYKNLLNSWAYSYSISTKLNRMDLFGEALIGLARACRDWQESRGGNFVVYATYKIKDALNEFVKDNSATISVPAYIKKANSNLIKAKSICESYNVNWHRLVIDREIPDKFSERDTVIVTQIIANLVNAAERAKVDYEKFIHRVECIPQNADYSNQGTSENDQRLQEQLEAALMVEKLKVYMDDDELTICEGIMEDKTYDQIANEMGKSKTWISEKLSTLRKNIIDKIGNN